MQISLNPKPDFKDHSVRCPVLFPHSTCIVLETFVRLTSQANPNSDCPASISARLSNTCTIRPAWRLKRIFRAITVTLRFCECNRNRVHPLPCLPRIRHKSSEASTFLRAFSQFRDSLGCSMGRPPDSSLVQRELHGVSTVDTCHTVSAPRPFQS